MTNFLHLGGGKKLLSIPLLLLCLLCTFACKDNNDSDGTLSYDSSKPVTITDFTPKDGGVGQRMVIYGSNFGNDTALVNVTIGGKKAVLINAKGNCLYCLVPQGAYSGVVKVSVGNIESGNFQTAEATTTFDYQRKMVVGTLCGYRNENDDQGWHDGPFSSATGFSAEATLTVDPLHKDHIYICYDGIHGIQQIDLTNKTVSTVMSLSMFDYQRLRSLDFTVDGQYMIISTDRDDRRQASPSVWIVKRNADGTFSNSSAHSIIAAYMQCNTAAVHPVNGEIYFNSYERGQVFRLDMNKYFNTVNSGHIWKPNFIDGNFEQLFTIGDNRWEFKLFIHPSGKYCYIIVINQHYILRADYNETTKRFAPAYVVAGQMRIAGWKDGVGTNVLLNRPYQGVFVKNKKYVKEGRNDVYDFYFIDNRNHCVRSLSPDGIISTFAGRGTSSQAGDSHYWGTEDGDLREVARFRDPTGITYDEENNTFYILDSGGRRVRTISMEK